MALKDIFGHSRQIAQLRRAIQSGRVPHAYLFSGVEGVGKRLVAENIAKVFNCHNPVDPQNNLDACDECASCKKIRNKTHPDVRIVEPDGENIKVEQLRDVLRDVSFKPYEGRWKVFIFDRAESLLPATANLFLKTLEEPTKRTLFILISSKKELLLPTIVSRCQNVKFGGIPLNQLSDILKKEFKLSDEEAGFYALAAEGSIGRGTSLVTGEWKKASETYLETIQKFLSSADLDSATGIEALFSLSEKLAQDKEHLPLILELISSWYRDIIVWKESGENTYLLNKSSFHEIKQEATKLPIEELFRRVDRLEELKISLEYNTNKQLALDNFFIKSLETRESQCS